jgi:hypothetical protein
MSFAIRTYTRFIVCALFLCGLTLHATAQGDGSVSTPKVELFGGYAYFYPHAVISGVQVGGTLPLTSCLCADVRGVGASATYNFNRWIGLTGDFSGSWSGAGNTVSTQVGKANFFAYSAGPKFTFRSHHAAPFAEALIGEQRLSPSLFPSSNGFSVIAGGGLDLPLGTHVAIRLFRADYVVSNHQITPAPTPSTDIRGLRLETGVVFLFGAHHHPAPAMMATVAPVPLPVAAPVAAPALQPLTLSLVATPAAIMAGESSTIVASANSPGGGPLTFNFETNGGTLSGTGATVELATVGMAAGIVQVTGHVMDDQGQTATAVTSVTLSARPIAAAVSSSALCSMSFARDKRRPVRVDNEAKACLDDIALNLQRNSDAQLIMVGNAAANEAGGKRVAAQRAVDAKEYLVVDKGIESSRIVLYTGDTNTKSVETTIVPLGATFDSATMVPVSPDVKARPRTHN